MTVRGAVRSVQGNLQRRMASARMVAAIVALAWTADRPRSLVLAAVVPARALGTIAFPLLVGYVVRDIPAATQLGMDSDAGHRVLLAVIGLTVSLVLQQVLPIAQETASDLLVRKVRQRVQRELMEAASAPPSLSQIEGAAIQGQVGFSKFALYELGPVEALLGMPNRAVQSLQLLGATVLLIAFAPILALGLFVVVVLQQTRSAASFKRMAEVQSGLAAPLRRSSYVRELATTWVAPKETRVFGLAEWLVSTFESAWRSGIDEVERARSSGRRSLMRTTALTVAATSGAFLFLAFEVANDRVTVSTAVIAAQALIMMLAGIAEETSARDSLWLSYGIQGTTAIKECLDTLRGSDTRPLERAGGVAAEGVCTVTFDDVHFSYPGSEAAVLRGVTFTIERGEAAALVGLNGAGKSTLIKLLCRFYEPTHGRVLVDGIPLAELNVEHWQRGISAVFQDFVRFPMTALDNIAVGAWEAADLATVERVAADVGVLPRLSALADGWDTVLSSQLGGQDLSGGEWQKIALARALLGCRFGARLVVLDEPTSHLDIRAEAEWNEQFLRLRERFTTLMISHRFATVRRADTIHVLSDGVIAESGSHAELVDANGLYASLYRVQEEQFGLEQVTA